MADAVQAEAVSGEDGYTAATDEHDAEVARLTAEMEAAFVDAYVSWEDTLATEKANLAAETARASAEFMAFIDGRLASWATIAKDEKLNAKWQEDSYYRYNLLRLLQEKQASIDQAVADAIAEFSAAMGQELVDGNTFRADQRGEFDDHVSETRQALMDAFQADGDELEAIIDARRSALAGGLDDVETQHADAMQADRELMKLRLKEVYSYNSYDLDKIETQEHIAAPYNYE